MKNNDTFFVTKFTKYSKRKYDYKLYNKLLEKLNLDDLIDYDKNYKILINDCRVYEGKLENIPRTFEELEKLRFMNENEEKNPTPDFDFFADFNEECENPDCTDNYKLAYNEPFVYDIFIDGDLIENKLNEIIENKRLL